MATLLTATAKQDAETASRLSGRGSVGSWRVSWLMVAITALSLVLAACGPTGGKSPTPPPTGTATAPSPTSVKVYFARHPESDENPTHVLAVTRTVPAGRDPTFFAVQSVIDGPSAAEQAQGYYSPLFGKRTVTPAPYAGVRC